MRNYLMCLMNENKVQKCIKMSKIRLIKENAIWRAMDDISDDIKSYIGVDINFDNLIVITFFIVYIFFNLFI